MLRALLFFSLSAILSVITFYGKPESTLDLHLAAPVGAYFILATLLSLRPKVSTAAQLQFAALSLLIWLVLFSFSYNVLFAFLVPLSGGIGAWLISILGKRLLAMQFGSPWQIILTGVLTAVLGLLFMILVKEMPKETYTIGLKAGVISGLWQLGVGLQLKKHQITD
jgi:hypothetical protein